MASNKLTFHDKDPIRFAASVIADSKGGLKLLRLIQRLHKDSTALDEDTWLSAAFLLTAIKSKRADHLKKTLQWAIRTRGKLENLE